MPWRKQQSGNMCSATLDPRPWPYEVGNPSPLFLSADELRSEEHTSELQSQSNLVCRLLLEKKNQHTSYRSPPIVPTLPPCRPRRLPFPHHYLSSCYTMRTRHRLPSDCEHHTSKLQSPPKLS